MLYVVLKILLLLQLMKWKLNAERVYKNDFRNSVKI